MFPSLCCLSPTTLPTLSPFSSWRIPWDSGTDILERLEPGDPRVWQLWKQRKIPLRQIRDSLVPFPRSRELWELCCGAADSRGSRSIFSWASSLAGAGSRLIPCSGTRNFHLHSLFSRMSLGMCDPPMSADPHGHFCLGISPNLGIYV